MGRVRGPNSRSLALWAGLWLTAGSMGVSTACHQAMAQPPAVPRAAPAGGPADDAGTNLVAGPVEAYTMPEVAGAEDPVPDLPGLPLPPSAEPPHEAGWLNRIAESMFADRADLWRPLSLRTFLSEGWDEPWSSPPRSSTGAPRQAFINAFDGVFYRLYLLSFSYYTVLSGTFNDRIVM